jgi:Domain of unknown function (DUF4157)/Bacterial protein of unknown function (DUF922)
MRRSRTSYKIGRTRRYAHTSRNRHHYRGNRTGEPVCSPRLRCSPLHMPPPSPIMQALYLQQHLGNRSTGAMLEARLNRMRGMGQEMPELARHYFERRFGEDFSSVRIHTKPRTAKIADALRARAFTKNKDIYFAHNQYEPGSQKGRKLLAHELAHVTQQKRQPGINGRIQRYTVPGKLKCNQLVKWLNKNPHYAPEWAATKCTYSFKPEDWGMFKVKKKGGRYIGMGKGNPKTKVLMSAPIDMPKWNPSKRKNRNNELIAWKAMTKSLKKHEREHRRLGEVGRKKIQSNARALYFEVRGKSRADAEKKVATGLINNGKRWEASAQAEQDKFDKNTGHGHKKFKKFPKVHLKCP